MTSALNPDRGAEAYRQAYEYIAAGGAFRTKRGMRRAAMKYLRLTASPPLTETENASARNAMRQIRQEQMIMPDKHNSSPVKAIRATGIAAAASALYVTGRINENDWYNRVNQARAMIRRAPARRPGRDN